MNASAVAVLYASGVKSRIDYLVFSGLEREADKTTERLCCRLLHWFDMHPNLTSLERIDELDRLLADSRQQPVLLFKHSFTCGVSAEALDELISHLSEENPDVLYAMVTVQTHREVSNAVSTKLGIRHETPQALLVRDGRVVWSASHFRVNAESLSKAVRANIS